MGGVIEEFVSVTSLHGVPDAYNAKDNFLRCIWTMITLGALGGLGYEVWLLLAEFQDAPIITQYQMVSAAQMDFPVVQICPSDFISTSKTMGPLNYHPAAVDFLKLLFPSFTEKVTEQAFQHIANSTSRFEGFPIVTNLVNSDTVPDMMAEVGELMGTSFEDISVKFGISEEVLKLNLYYNTHRKALEGLDYRECLREVFSGKLTTVVCDKRKNQLKKRQDTTLGSVVSGAFIDALGAGVNDSAVLLGLSAAAAEGGLYPAVRTLAEIAMGLDAGTELETLAEEVAQKAGYYDAQYNGAWDEGVQDFLYFPASGVPPSTAEAEEMHSAILKLFTRTPKDPIEFAQKVAVDMDKMLVSCSWKGSSGAEAGACGKLARQTFDQQLGNCFTFDQPGFERTQNLEGFGLSLVININQDDVWKSWPASTAGVNVRIMDNYEPIKTDSLYAPVGTNTKVNLRGTKFELIAGDKHKICHENIPRTIFNENYPYSDSLCRSECVYKLSQKVCGAIPLVPDEFLVNASEVRVTTFRHLNCLMPLFYGGDWEKLGGIACIENCRPSCNYWDYTPIVTSTKFPSEAFQEWFDFTTETDPIDLGKNYLVLEVTFAKLQYTRMTQKFAISINGFISQIGGNVGLFVGASMISLAQILIYFGVWVGDTLCGISNPKTKLPTKVEIYSGREGRVPVPRPKEAPRRPPPQTFEPRARTSVAAEAEGYVE